MASKTTGTKKNAKQSTAKKRQPTKKTSAKSAKSAKTTRKNTIKSCAAGRIISCNGDSDLGDTCGRDSAHNQQFRTCRCIWKKDCSTAAGNDGLDGVCISTAFILWSRVCGFQ